MTSIPNGRGIGLALAFSGASFAAADDPLGYVIAAVFSGLFLALAIGAGVQAYREDRKTARLQRWVLDLHHGTVHRDDLSPGVQRYRWWCACTSWGRRDTWEEAHEAFDAHLRAAHVRARVHQ